MRPVIWILALLISLSFPLTSERAIAQTDELQAEPAPEADSVDPVPEPPVGIRAKAYPLTSSRSSKSGRIYLFDDVEATRPAPGKILLLRKDRAFVAGLRVLRTYLDRKQVAARVVKTYPEFPEIPIGETFSAAEKIGSFTLPKLTPVEVEREAKMDEADLTEIESDFDTARDSENTLTEEMDAPQAAPPIDKPSDSLAPDPTIPDFDPELDAGTQQKPLSELDPDDEEEELDPSLLENPLEIHEIERLDDSRNMMSISFGVIRNRSSGGGLAPFRTGAIRYSRQVLTDIFQNSHTRQDDLSLEVSMFVYQVLNPRAGSSFTAVPTGLNLRYTLNFGNEYALFVYGGGTYSQVISQINASRSTLAGVEGPVMAFGAGALINVGPSWFARLDVGFDNITVGLSLKF